MKEGDETNKFKQKGYIYICQSISCNSLTSTVALKILFQFFFIVLILLNWRGRGRKRIRELSLFLSFFLSRKENKIKNSPFFLSSLLFREIWCGGGCHCQTSSSALEWVWLVTWRVTTTIVCVAVSASLILTPILLLLLFNHTNHFFFFGKIKKVIWLSTKKYNI